MDTSLQRTLSPVDGSVFVTRPLAGPSDIANTLAASSIAQRAWARVSLAERRDAVTRMVAALLRHRDDAAAELTMMMGRPIRHSPGELRGFEERATTMVALAELGLADVQVAPKEGFVRFVRRVPLGVVFVVAPWNYPYLTSVNAFVPALLAGNTVLMKASAQTPLVAERIARACDDAGLPRGVFSFLHLSHEDTQRVVQAPEVAFVCFTGSVAGGKAIERAAAGRFIGLGLELGGKDPAYVREDADLAYAVDSLVDGSFYNSGQSCCGIERIYVHERLYERFVEAAVASTEKYVLGDPREPSVTLGPMVRASAADFVRAQVAEAVRAGARSLVDASRFTADAAGTPYLAPVVLVDVTHGMQVMTEETFGPVACIMKVASDDEALRYMNDSRYGLTAAVYTRDVEAAMRLGAELETGTVFMNRCDYLDPSLAWTGVKDSGRGCTLSVLGFEQLTRPKSFHLKLP